MHVLVRGYYECVGEIVLRVCIGLLDGVCRLEEVRERVA